MQKDNVLDSNSFQASNSHQQILIVDDEAYVSKVVSKMLQKEGYQTLTAVTGGEAVEIFSKHSDHIDLILLDFILPDMECVAVFNALKKIDPHIKVILATGVSKEDQSHKLPEGLSGFLQKPFKMKALSSFISDVLTQKGTHPAAYNTDNT